jgi:hypothetical protein
MVLTYGLGADTMNESSIVWIPNVASGRNNTNQRDIMPSNIPRFVFDAQLSPEHKLSNMLPGAVPVKICKPSPIYWAVVGSSIPREIPTQKKCLQAILMLRPQ